MLRSNEVKFHNVVLLENLFSAWEEFVKGKRGKRDVQEFQLHLADNILSLHCDLVSKIYRHGPYIHFVISDPKRRDIHKASVRDRLLHHALHRKLYSYFDRLFISDVYSSRVGKGTHRAMEQFRRYGYKVSKNNTRTCFVLKCDIKKFFASVDHDILLSILKKHITDSNVLWLLENIISSFHIEQTYTRNNSHELFHACRSGRNTGLALGNLTSQLLVNVYMHEFDQYVKHKLKICHYVRYADDFVLLHHDRETLTKIIRYIVCFLKNHLQLSLHPDKVFVKTFASGVDFLGWVHFPDHRILRTATKRRMLTKLARNPKEETVQSYLGVLGHGNTCKLKKLV